MKMYSYLTVLVIVTLSVAKSQDFWEYVPTPNDNEIGGITVAPNGDLYACGLGVFRSTDKGKTWLGINKIFWEGKEIYLDEVQLFFSNIIVTKAGTVLAGVYDGMPLRSTDRGETWELLQEALGDEAYYIIDSSNVLYSACSKGLLYSKDEGKTWAKEISVDNKADITSMITDKEGNVIVISYNKIYTKKKNENTFSRDSAWVGVYNGIKSLAFNNEYLFGGTYKGIYRSNDGGKTWGLIEGILESAKINSITSDSDGNIYACVENNGIYVTTDNGSTWSVYDDLFPKFNVINIVFSNNNEYVATNGLYTRSSKEGIWENITEGLGRPWVKLLGISGSGKELIASNTSIYYTTNHGYVWNKHKSPFFDSTYKSKYLTFIIDKGGNWFYGIDSLLYRSADEGKNWQLMKIFRRIEKLFTDKSGAVYLYDWLKSEVYQLKDDGETWSKILGLNNSVYFDINHDGIFISADSYDSLKISYNRGKSWDSYYVNDKEYGGSIRKVVLNDDNIYIAKGYTGFMYSTDKGKSWYRNNEGIENKLEIANKINDVFIFMGEVYITGSLGVFKAQDVTQPWQKFEPGMKHGIGLEFSYLKDHHLYVTTSAGLYRSHEHFTSVGDEIIRTTDLLNIYPNPANDFIILPNNIDYASDIYIYSTLGRLVYSGMSSGKIDISILAPGAYLVKTRDKVFRFLKM